MVAWSVCAVLATVELIKEISCRFWSLKPETQQTPFVNHPMNNLMFDWNSWLFIKLARSWNNHEGSLSLKVLSVFWKWAGFLENNALTKKVGFDFCWMGNYGNEYWESSLASQIWPFRKAENLIFQMKTVWVSRGVNQNYVVKSKKQYE